MPDDKRLDLDADLDKVADDFVKDVEAATKEVKQRKAADLEKDRRSTARVKDRKLSMIIIAAATVLLLLVAYWAVFARQPNTGTAPPVVSTQNANPKLNAPVSTTTTPKAPPRRARNNQAGQQQPYGDDLTGQ